MKKRAFFNILIVIVLMSTLLTMLPMCRRVQGPNRAPVAQAGWDQTVEPHEMVALDGSESFDPDGDNLTYQWDLVASPSNGRALLTGVRGVKTCRLSPDAIGVWMIRLTVYDGRLSEQNVLTIRVQEPPPEPTPPPPPRTTVPDLEVVEFLAAGVYQDTYIKDFKARVRTRTGNYGGPLDFRIIGLDKLSGGQFTFDRTVTFDDVSLLVGDERKWFTLLKHEIDWPEDVCQVSFGVVVDPGDKIEEVNEQNNVNEKTIYRDNLVGHCDARIFPEIIKVGKANLRPVPNGGSLVLPSDEINIFIQFRNCCPVNKKLELSFIYDWTHLLSDGENKSVRKSKQTFESGEDKALTFTNIKIPKKREFKTLAIRRQHEQGYDILYTIDVRVDY